MNVAASFVRATANATSAPSAIAPTIITVVPSRPRRFRACAANTATSAARKT